MANISPQKIVPEPPYKSPIADQSGFLSQAWMAFFRQVHVRIGGSTAYSNLELENLQTTDLTSLTAQVSALTNTVNSLGISGLGIGRVL